MVVNTVSRCNLVLALLTVFVILSLFFVLELVFEWSIINMIKSSIIYQGILFSSLLIITIVLLTYYKNSQNTYIEQRVNEMAQQILQENVTLQRESSIDTLTHIANRKYFDQRLEQEFKRALREHTTMALVIVNLNEFHAFNELYGRTEGDKALKKVAQALIKQCNRPSDMVARVNSDEFFILLPNTKMPEEIAKRCLGAINSLQIPHDNSVTSNILMASVGCASVEAKESVQMLELVTAAKESLKQAKKHERNRVS